MPSTIVPVLARLPLARPYKRYRFASHAFAQVGIVRATGFEDAKGHVNEFLHGRTDDQHRRLAGAAQAMRGCKLGLTDRGNAGK